MNLSLSSSTHPRKGHGAHGKKVAICKPGKELSSETNHAVPLILNSCLPNIMFKSLVVFHDSLSGLTTPSSEV